jgi:DNA-binding MarR family transcriptional regulator
VDEKGVIGAQDLAAQFKRVDFLLHHRLWNEFKLKERPASFMLLANVRKAAKEGEDGARVSELALVTGITASGITQMVTALEERGMVGRKMDPEDRRAVRVFLTEEGRRATDQMMSSMDSVFGGLTEYLGQEKSRAFLEILNDVIQYFDDQSPLDCQDSDTKASK